MKVIYADTLFLINLLTDYLLCLSAGRVCGLKLKRGRYLAAAVLGAGYSVAAVLPGLEMLSHPLCKLLCLLLMGLAAYGGEDSPLRCTAVFALMSAAFAGLLWAIGGDMGSPSLPALSGGMLIIGFVICYIVICLIFMYRWKNGRKTVSAYLEENGTACHFTVLLDSGSNLRDPVSGSEVMVVCPEVLNKLFPGSQGLFQLSDPVELMAASPSFPPLNGRLRLIPYTSLGGEGMLAAFKPEKLTVDGEGREDILIAVSSRVKGEGFEGIL